MLFAAAMTKTELPFSCNQVRKVPKTRDEVPLSFVDRDSLKPFSISSIHKIEGEMASAVLMAVRIFSSLLPTYALKILPTSRRRRGSCHVRSEERRVGKERRSRWSPYH